MSKVKVGDVVRPVKDMHDVSSEKTYVVREVQYNDVVWVDDDKNETYPLWLREYRIVYTISPNDTVRLKAGAPFTTGAYTAEVDSARGDIVLLKHGSWLPVDAVEKVEVKEQPQRVKIGDKVRVVRPGVFREDTKAGDIGTVIDVSCDGSKNMSVIISLQHRRDGAITQWCGPESIEVIDPAASAASDLEPLVLSLSVDASSLSRDLADQFQRIADALRAA